MGNQTVLLCSAAGDDGRAPVSMLLLEREPEAVVRGILSCGAERGADRCRLYLPERYADAADAACGAARAAGIDVVTGADSPVCRDETALLAAARGKLIRPFHRDAGEPLRLDGDEVHVVTVEQALARQTGDTGRWVYVLGAVAREGLVQAAPGATLADILELAGGLRAGAVCKAVLAGGETGCYCAPDKLGETYLDAALPGCVEVLDEAVCGVDHVKLLLDCVQRDSCGKCPLCREGSYQLAAFWNDITAGKAKAEGLAFAKTMAETIAAGAFCDFGRCAAGTVLSALAVLGAETEEHVRRKRCPAGVCKRFLTMAILPDKCTGCGDCLDVCGEDAIEGKAGFIHMLDNDACEKCGKCVKACEEDAIVFVGAVRPKLPKKLTKVGRFKA